MPDAAPAPPPHGLSAYIRGTREPAVAALAVVPVALLYGLGLLLATPNARSGVDFVTDALLSALGTHGYIGVQAAVAGLVLVWATTQLGTRTPRRMLWTLPIIAESLVYALVMGSGILWLMESQHLLGPILIPADLVDRAVLSTGAGLHEELVFRLALIPLCLAIASQALRMPRQLAWLFAIGASSLAFAGAHHLTGAPFNAFVFTYRAIAGVIFALLFLSRGLGVAVWTHTLYDFQALSLAEG